MNTRISLQLAGSNDVFLAPTGFSEEAAVRWLARLYHSTADRRVSRISPRCWACNNGRRGVNRRGTVITVLSQA